MKIQILLSAMILGLVLLSCSKDEKIITSPQQPVVTGKIAITIAEPPSEITRVVATLSREGFTDISTSLAIPNVGRTATGELDGVPVGLWHLRVDALNDSDIIKYTGQTDVQVVGGQVTSVDLELLPSTGVVEIHVRWGSVCVTPSPGIVAWWSGDGNAGDLIGGNHGLLYGGVTYVPAVVGQGFHFDGVSSSVRFHDNDNLKFTGSFSIETWIYIDTLPPVQRYGGQIFFRGDNRGGNDPYSLTCQSNGNLQFLIESNDASATSLLTPAPLRQYIHVAATFDSAVGEMKLYVNGILKADTLTDVRPFRDLDSNYNPGAAIGNTQDPSVYNEPFKGIIDELTLYNRTLSADEVKSIYLAGSGGKCRP